MITKKNEKSIFSFMESLVGKIVGLSVILKFEELNLNHNEMPPKDTGKLPNSADCFFSLKNRLCLIMRKTWGLPKRQGSYQPVPDPRL